MRPPRVLARLRTRATRSGDAGEVRTAQGPRMTPSTVSTARPAEGYACSCSPRSPTPRTPAPAKRSHTHNPAALWAGRDLMAGPCSAAPAAASPAAAGPGPAGSGASCSSRASPATPPSGLCWPDAPGTERCGSPRAGPQLLPRARTTPDPTKHSGFQVTKNKLAAAALQPGGPAPVAGGRKPTEAGKAAKPPADDKESQANKDKAGEMGAAPAGTKTRPLFIAAVSAAISAKQAPKNLWEADSFSTSGKSDAVAAEVKGKVSASKDASAKPMADVSKKPPDTGKAKEKPLAPLPPTAGCGSAPRGRRPHPRCPEGAAEQTQLGNAPGRDQPEDGRGRVTETSSPSRTNPIHGGPGGEEGRRTAQRDRSRRLPGQGGSAAEHRSAGGAGRRGPGCGRDAHGPVRGDGRGGGGQHQKAQSKNEAQADRGHGSGSSRSSIPPRPRSTPSGSMPARMASTPSWWHRRST